jgi:subtilisin family serine protease
MSSRRVARCKPVATSPTPTMPATPLPAGTGPLPNVISQAPILPPAPFPSGIPTAPAVMRSLPGEGIGRSGISAGPVGRVRAMPAGGVIGGPPGVGPCETTEGVAPVVVPVAEQHVDPEPAIGLAYVIRRGIRASIVLVVLAVVSVLPAGPAWADNTRVDEWHLAYLKVAQAQAIAMGNGVVVGVVDSGVFPHQDVRANLLKGTDVVTGGHGDGQVDQKGHGTEMASLIAGHGKNANDGVLGIAPAAKILPVKTANATDNGGSAKLGDGIKWAAEHGAKVINVSAGAGPTFNMQDGVAAAKAADALIVAATGNTSEASILSYPAALPGVLAVGAIDRSGKRAAFSITGPATQICAPGVAIIAAEPKERVTG